LSEPDAAIFDVDKVIARIEAQSPDMPKKQVYDKATEIFLSKLRTKARKDWKNKSRNKNGKKNSKWKGS